MEVMYYLLPMHRQVPNGDDRTKPSSVTPVVQLYDPTGKRQLMKVDQWHSGLEEKKITNNKGGRAFRGRPEELELYNL